MIEDQLFEIIEPVLRPLGAVSEAGEEFQTPPLNVLRYYFRPVRLHWVPLFGAASSVVAVLRQPVDTALGLDDYRRLLTRLAMAVNGRFPPWRWRLPRFRRGAISGSGGLVIGLTALILTPEPIEPGDDATLAQVLTARTRTRAVPMGLIRLNLGQEAAAFSLATGPAGLFPEPAALAEALSLRFRRYVPLIGDAMAT